MTFGDFQKVYYLTIGKGKGRVRSGTALASLVLLQVVLLFYIWVAAAKTAKEQLSFCTRIDFDGLLIVTFIFQYKNFLHLLLFFI